MGSDGTGWDRMGRKGLVETGWDGMGMVVMGWDGWVAKEGSNSPKLACAVRSGSSASLQSARVEVSY